VYGEKKANMIEFEVSGLEEGSTNALKHYEVKFTEPVNANWLIQAIRAALDVAQQPTTTDEITVWECDRCKSQNTPTAIACAVCGAIRQPKAPAPHGR
jgi:hypothetical protein